MTDQCGSLGVMGTADVQAIHSSRVGADTQAAHASFAAALGSRADHGAEALGRRPLVLRCSSPLPELLNVYLYRPTSPESERKEGTYRIQITGLAPRRERGHFDRSNGALPLLAGFEPDLRVFVLWDAGIYDRGEGIVWSRNVQVAGRTIFDAMARGMSEELRHLRGGHDEIVVACTAGQLDQGIVRRWDLTLARLLAEGA